MKWSVVISGCCLLLPAVNIALIHQNNQMQARLALPLPALEAAVGAFQIEQLAN